MGVAGGKRGGGGRGLTGDSRRALPATVQERQQSSDSSRDARTEELTTAAADLFGLPTGFGQKKGWSYSQEAAVSMETVLARQGRRGGGVSEGCRFDDHWPTVMLVEKKKKPTTGQVSPFTCH